MSGPGHERWEDAAGAYVLGALPDDERAAFEAHLAAARPAATRSTSCAWPAQALPVSATRSPRRRR